MFSRAVFLMLAGALGGLLAWVISEPFAPAVVQGATDQAWQRFEQIFGLAAGVLIGLFVGGISGLLQGSKIHLLRGAFGGALLGAIAGTLGVGIASALFSALLGGRDTLAGTNIIQLLIARTFGFAVFGLLIGLAEGAVGRSIKRALQGALGGLIGGGLGGFAFDIVGALVGPLTVAMRGGNEVGSIPRAVALVVMGAGIGFFIGLIEAIARSAWVRVMYGRNEGKEYLIDAPQNFLGRSENAHVPLFGDPQVAPVHACIARQSGQYILIDNGTPMGTGLNGQRIQQAMLTSGDMIQVGSFQIQFLLKSGRAVRVTDYRPQPITMPPQGSQSVSVPSQGYAGMSYPGMPLTHAATPAGPTIAFPATQTGMGPSQMQVPMLIALNGPLAGQRFPVNGVLEVGRESQQLSLSFDNGVSRKHAQFSQSPNGLLLTDLGSTNGTLVNGQRAQSQYLKLGDIVQIGLTQFRVEV